MKIKASIIIPCRNEEKFIKQCLDSVLAQDFLKSEMEILVVDGMSHDKTREIVSEFAKSHTNLKFLENPKTITSSALNIGIRQAVGEIIIRLDSHARYPKDYIQNCVRHLEESGADNVGGWVKTMPAAETEQAKAIAACLSSSFGAGSADFRTEVAMEQETDTVFGGCWKKETLNKIGFFNEKMERSQDYEYNMRIKRAGGKIKIFPDITAEYFPQADFSGFARHNFDDGIWSVLSLKYGRLSFSWRHYLPMIFVGGLSFALFFSIFSSFFGGVFWAVLLIYVFASFYFAKSTARFFRAGIWQTAVAFWVRHLCYGFGSWWGVFLMLKNKNGKQESRGN